MLVNMSLPIFFLREDKEPHNLEKECDVENLKFFDIAAMGPYREASTHKEYTMIYANGEVFVCKYPPDELEKLIKKNIPVVRKETLVKENPDYATAKKTSKTH